MRDEFPGDVWAAKIDTLARITRDNDLAKLETFCLSRNYRQVRQAAINEGIELDELEEMLWRL